MAVENGIDIDSTTPNFTFETQGINDRLQLANLERTWQLHQANTLMAIRCILLTPIALICVAVWYVAKML